MPEWDDERASISGREIHSNVPRKAMSSSPRDRRIMAVVAILPIAIAIMLVWLLRR